MHVSNVFYIQKLKSEQEILILIRSWMQSLFSANYPGKKLVLKRSQKKSLFLKQKVLN